MSGGRGVSLGPVDLLQIRRNPRSWDLHWRSEWGFPPRGPVSFPCYCATICLTNASFGRESLFGSKLQEVNMVGAWSSHLHPSTVKSREKCTNACQCPAHFLFFIHSRSQLKKSCHPYSGWVFFPPHLNQLKILWGWKDGLSVKSTCFSCGRSKLGPQIKGFSTNIISQIKPN